MNSATFSKFDSEPACEESAPDFVPSHNDLIDSLPQDVLESSYRQPVDIAANLFNFGVALNRVLFP